MKRCSACKEEKDPSMFAKTKLRVDGLQDHCKECQAVKRKAYREKLKQSKRSPPENKFCPTCKETKPTDAFYTSISKTSGLQDNCKSCQNAKTMVYLQQHPEQRDSANKKYRDKNPEKVKHWDRNAKIKRRAHLDAAIQEDITLDELFERDGGFCGICDLECSRDEASIDHIIPLSKKGNHTWNNVQLAHRRCNSIKKDKIQEPKRSSL